MTVKLRRMTPLDQKFVLEVRNEDAVRANSLTDTVKDDQWFRARMNDPSHLPYIIMVDGENAGIASLQFVSSITAEVSLAIAPAWRGKGLASRVIDELVAEGWKSGIERFLATVRGNNISSLRSFLREGFTPTKWVYLEKRK